MRPLRVRRPAPLLLVSALAVSGCDEETGSSPSRPVIPTGNTDDGESVNRCDTALRLPPAATLPPLRGTFAPDATLDALLRVPADLPYRPGPFAVSASLLADFNGDGRTDLLLNDQRDTAGGQPQPPAAPSRVWIALQQDNGTLGAPARVPGVHRCHLAADLDGDQRLDLVCGLDRGSSAVLWGTAGGYDVARLTELPVPDPPIAVAAWDLDLDGGLDLVLSSFGRRTTVVHARGARRFDDVTARWGVDVQGLTFQAAFLDFDGDGRHDLYFSDDGSGHENRAFRTVQGDRDPDPRFERVRPTEAACDPMGFFGTSNAAAMGVALADLNRDGLPELLLATGPDIPVLARRRAAPFNWVDVRARLTLDQETTTTGTFLVPWSPVLWDMDHDGATDLWVATGDDVGFSMMPNRGDSRLLVYRGGADARFTEVADSLRAGVTGQFAHIQLGDLDHDGDLDVVLGRWSAPPVALRNDLMPAGRHVLLDLRGTVSNPHGLGASVRVGTSPQVFPVGDRWTPWGTAQPTLDLTLPSAPAQDLLLVRWPSGLEQTVRGPITTPRLTVTEPRWLSLSPEGTRLTAGSDETRTVRVDPALLGAREGAAVEIDAADASTPWTGPAARDPNGTWTRTLRAPASPSSVVLRVRVDGVSLPARPRIWVDAR